MTKWQQGSFGKLMDFINTHYNKLLSSTWLLSSFLTGLCLTIFIAELPSEKYLLSIAGIFSIVFIVMLVCNNKPVATALCPLVMLFVGYAYACVTFQHQVAQPFPSPLESKDFYVTGTIDGLPDTNYKRSRLQLTIERAFSVKTVTEHTLLYSELSGKKIQLSCYRCEHHFSPDQRWQLRVRLKRPHRYASWGAFDYEKYLFRQQIIANGYVRDDGNNQLLEESKRLSANSFREKIKTFVNTELDESKRKRSVGQGVLIALLIGDKSQLGYESKQVFQTLGLSHLMAISGLHIGIVFLFTSWLVRIFLWPIATIYYWQPRQYIVSLPALVSAFAYSSLAGFSVSTQRALIMLVIYVFCRLLAREINLLRVLLLTAFAVLIYDPRSILDAGFWLSFNAVLVIAVFSQNGGKLNLWKLQPILWLGMLPISLLFFAQASLISPLVNLIIVPLFSLTVIPLALVSILFWLSGVSDVAIFLLSNTSVFIDYLFIYFNKVALLSDVIWHVNSLSTMVWLIYAAVIISYLYQLKYRHLTWLILLISISINWSAANKLGDGEFKLTLLDVGQGLSLAIQTRESTTVYDTGPAYEGSFSTANAVLIPYLRQQGVTLINELIVSHADNDHRGGVEDLLANFQAQRILTSRTDLIINSQECVNGQQWQHDNVLFEMLSPDNNTPDGSNNRSCVLKVSSSYGSVLIPGDIEKKVEDYLLQQKLNLRAETIIAPHHGSNSSSNNTFIDAVSPSLVLFSAGYINRYKHPHPNVIMRYKHHRVNSISTINSGSIEIQYTKNARLINTFRDSEQHFWSVKK